LERIPFTLPDLQINISSPYTLVILFPDCQFFKQFGIKWFLILTRIDVANVQLSDTPVWPIPYEYYSGAY
jgi:hypothetical protein